MLKTKSKQKRSPRRPSLIWLGLILLIFFGASFLVFTFGEDYLNEWLADDPFTPMCNVEALEVAYLSNAQGEDHLYRMRANGDKPVPVSDLSDEWATTFQWTNDGRYLVFYMANTSAGQLHVVDAATSDTRDFTFSQDDFYWYLLEDSSAIIVQLDRDCGCNRTEEVYYQISLPLTENTHPVEIGTDIPTSLIPHDYHVFTIDYNIHSTIFNNAQQLYPDAQQFMMSPTNSFLVTTERIRRAGVNHQEEIYVYDTASDALIWQIGETIADFDLQYVLQDISPSDEILFYRSYYNIAENQIPRDKPYEVFIANVDTQSIQPILEDRPYNRFRGLTWSPDGQWMLITFVNDETDAIEAYVGDHLGNNRTFVSSISSGDFTTGNYQWTPDGRYLSYVASNDWIYLMDLQSRTSCRVAKGRDGVKSTTNHWRLIPESER